jgi:hypothetical protein
MTPSPNDHVIVFIKPNPGLGGYKVAKVEAVDPETSTATVALRRQDAAVLGGPVRRQPGPAFRRTFYKYAKPREVSLDAIRRHATPREVAIGHAVEMFGSETP